MENKESNFRKAIEENKDRIYRICCYYITDEDSRMDLYQEIMINIWKELGSFRGESAIGTWIYRIAVNTSLLFIHKEKRRKLINVKLQDYAIENIIDESLVNEKVELENNIQFLYSSINKLTISDKTIISLVLEDFSYKDIGEITGLSVSNVGVKVNRVKQKLRKIMEGDR